MSTKFEYSSSGPFGRQYIIHLESKDEICLHALSILQAGLHPCYANAELSPSCDQLIFNLNGCIPLSDLKGKDAIYVRRNARSLLTGFLSEILLSLDHSMDLHGISYVSDNLFYNHTTKRLVCLFLPLASRLSGRTGRLSETDEHAFDELLHIPYEKKWISPCAMEKLYSFFRNDDEKSALSFIQNDLYEQSRPVPSAIRLLMLVWSVFFLFYLFCSVFIERRFAGTPVALLPGLLFFICTVCLLLAILLHFFENRKESVLICDEKEKRRKTRNAQMLFPEQSEPEKDSHPLALSDDPVQFIETSQRDPSSHPRRFTVWTNRCAVGQDSDICDLTFDHPSVALYHAVFCHDEHGFYIESLQSGKGTFKNRTRLRQNEKAYLEEGDIIGIGELEFVTRFVRSRDKENKKQGL